MSSMILILIFRPPSCANSPEEAAVIVITQRRFDRWRSATATTPWTSYTTTCGTSPCSSTSSRCTRNAVSFLESVGPWTSSLKSRSTSTTTRRSWGRLGPHDEQPSWDICVPFSYELNRDTKRQKTFRKRRNLETCFFHEDRKWWFGIFWKVNLFD